MCTAVHNAPVLPVHNMSPVVPVGTSASVAGDSRVQITSCALTAHLGNSFHDDDDDQDGWYLSFHDDDDDDDDILWLHLSPRLSFLLHPSKQLGLVLLLLLLLQLLQLPLLLLLLQLPLL